MPQTLSPLTEKPSLEPTPHRKRWTRQDCEFLVRSELLVGRYELIEGDIISKMGQKPPHSVVIMLLNDWLVGLFGGKFVRIQLSMDIATEDNKINEPEPDAAVVSQPATAFTENQPGPADMLLVVEVSDTTLRFDLRTKAALYARAGIVEYWVVDIVGRRIVVHRDPTSSGYRDIQAYTEEEALAPLARPENPIKVATLLPPA